MYSLTSVLCNVQLKIGSFFAANIMTCIALSKLVIQAREILWHYSNYIYCMTKLMVWYSFDKVSKYLDTKNWYSL